MQRAMVHGPASAVIGASQDDAEDQTFEDNQPLSDDSTQKDHNVHLRLCLNRRITGRICEHSLFEI